ncbi:hypothetical protein AMQ84_04660 [Paenibacillus riograndensis]|uniref:Polymerase nucleotidyl transferase domain-containing protein n=1 Tax=Paenibacillus riograndensis TaxID=483937 RepID=A0A132U921_9BACL|nr:hypothetical protein [Paenibacillus riograndensis]KWX80174.1 hypothetical protein AMQ84_04660 [Paenibacillus riograndensis]
MNDLTTILKQFQVTEKQLLEQLQISDGDIVFVSGSVVEGYGNPQSDLDLFVIKESIEEVKAQFVYKDLRIQQIITNNNQRFDVEYHSVAKTLAYLELSRNFRADSLEDMEELDLKKIDFLHRLHLAIPLRASTKLKSLQEAINIVNVCSSLKNWKIRSYNAHLTDCLGMLQIDDLDTAVYWSRQTLSEAIDVLLALHFMSNPSDKWRFRKLADVAGAQSDIYMNYRRLMTREVSLDQRKNYIFETLKYAGNIVLEAQLQKQ